MNSSDIASSGDNASTLLDVAARCDQERVRALLKNGADINMAGPDGGTALHNAASFRHAEMARFLIERGADVNAVNNIGETPIWKCELDDLATLRVLLEGGADADHVSQSRTIITKAATEGASSAVQALIKAGAKVAWPEQADWLALHAAAHAGLVDMCRDLVAAGASPSHSPAKPSYFPYRTPFQRAVESRKLAVVRYFVEECGESIRQNTVEGNTMAQLARQGEVLEYVNAITTETGIQGVFGGAGNFAGDSFRKSSPSL
jgi:ankyrin repeat protein